MWGAATRRLILHEQPAQKLNTRVGCRLFGQPNIQINRPNCSLYLTPLRG